jgi:hypothetical protein
MFFQKKAPSIRLRISLAFASMAMNVQLFDFITPKNADETRLSADIRLLIDLITVGETNRRHCRTPHSKRHDRPNVNISTISPGS